MTYKTLEIFDSLEDVEIEINKLEKFGYKVVGFTTTQYKINSYEDSRRTIYTVILQSLHVSENKN